MPGGRRRKGKEKDEQRPQRVVVGANWVEPKSEPQAAKAASKEPAQSSRAGSASATAAGQAASSPSGTGPSPASASAPPPPSSASSPNQQRSGAQLSLPVRQPPGPDVASSAAASSAASRAHDDSPRLTDESYAARQSSQSPANIHIKANFYEVQRFPQVLYQYSISFEEASINTRPVKNRSVRRILIAKLLQLDAFKGIDPQLATDWNALIISKAPLKEPQLSNEGGVKLFRVPFTNQADLPDRPPQDLSIKITRLADLDLAVVESYVRGQAERVDCSRYVTALNIICQKYASSGRDRLIRTGKNKYFENLDVQEEDQMQVDSTGRRPWKCGLHPRKGYFASIRLLDQRVMLNVNVAATAFYNRGLMRVFLENYFRADTLHDLRGEERNLKALTKTLQVRYIYDPPDHASNANARATMLAPTNIPTQGRLRRINAFGRSASNQEFQHGRFGRLTVEAYFNKYVLPGGRRLQYPELPVVNTGGRERPAWIPLELLWIVPHQPLVCNLRPDMITHMIQFARRIPQDNAWLIENGGKPYFYLNRLQDANSSFGLAVAADMHLAKGRRLNSPQPIYHQTNRFTQQQHPSMEGRWRLTGIQFSNPKPFGVLPVVNTGVSSPYLHHDEAAVLDWLAQNMRKYFSGPHPKALSEYANSPDLGLHSLNGALDKLKEKLKITQNPKPVLITLNERSEDDYARIKQWGDRSVGVPTMCAVWDKLQTVYNKKNPDMCANLALKANIKLGGTNHYLEGCFDELRDGSKKCDTMIVGADTTHPGAHAADFCPSIAAVVASLDANFTNYPGSMRLQSGKREVIEDLEDMMCERLAAWKARNEGRLPSKILFYRDGVSESQFAMVKRYELGQIVSACKKVGIEHPSITLLVVGKRHNTRFYPTKTNSRAQAGDNFHSGLVVDDPSVRMPYYFDFYLQSHGVGKNQGSARSGHYFVLENGMNLGADELQELTYNLCFLYARSVTAVSYATPAYYADKLCDRGRCYLRGLLQGQNRISANFDATDEERNKRMAVEHVKNDPNFWRCNGSSGRNPWHRNLDEIMFYL